ncbi:MAG: hypothetical protein AAF446_05535 [Pseudomonadota bacterium]
MTANRLLIEAPGLAHWLQAPDQMPGCLSRFFSRARATGLQDDLPIAAALGLLEIPAAPVCRLARGYDDAFNGYWLRFDPIVLLPDLTAVWIRSRVVMNLDDDASATLRTEFQQMLQVAGIDWQHQGSGEYGLIQTMDAIDCDFLPLDRVIGRRLDEVLPSGADQTRMRRMLNESQMIFHQQRALDHPGQQGMGLWFWGAGRLSSEPPSIGPVTMSCSQGVDQLSDEWLGLARWLNIELIEVSEYQVVNGSSLVDAGLIDSEPRLEALEQRWVQPAWAALASGRLHELMLIDGDCGWQLGRFDRWAFWRRMQGNLL